MGGFAEVKGFLHVAGVHAVKTALQIRNTSKLIKYKYNGTYSIKQVQTFLQKSFLQCQKLASQALWVQNPGKREVKSGATSLRLKARHNVIIVSK